MADESPLRALIARLEAQEDGCWETWERKPAGLNPQGDPWIMTCDGCGELKTIVAKYVSPDGEHEPWLCQECDQRSQDYDRILAVLKAAAELLDEVGDIRLRERWFDFGEAVDRVCSAALGEQP